MRQQHTILNVLQGRLWAVLMVALLFVLSGCKDPIDGRCIAAHNFGDIVRKTVEVPADGDVLGFGVRTSPHGNKSISDARTDEEKQAMQLGWVKTNINAVSGRELKIESTGSVDLCPTSRKPATFSPNPRSGLWQDSGVVVGENNLVHIEVTGGRYSEWVNRKKKCWFGAYACGSRQPRGCYGGTPWWGPDGCWSTKGRGLFAYIGDTPPDTWLNPDRYEDSPEFFEMHDYVSGRGGYLEHAPQAGRIWFRYAENNDSRLIDGTLRVGQSQTLRYCERHGKRVYEDKSEETVDYCAIPDDDPNRVINSYSDLNGQETIIYEDHPRFQQDCVLANRTLLVKQLDFGEDCTDGPILTGTKFITNGPFEGNYSNNASDSYKLSIQSGCIGTNGQYMVGSIGVPGTAASTEIDIHSYSFSPFFGTYIDEAPKSGPLWLKIIDDPTRDWGPNSKGMNGDGVYQGDKANYGSYQVTVETIKTKGCKPLGPLDAVLPDGATEWSDQEAGCGSLIHSIVDPIKREFLMGSDGQYSLAEALYNRILGSPLLEVNEGVFASGEPEEPITPGIVVQIIRLILVLYIMIYATMYILGMIQDFQWDFIQRIFKIGVIIALISPGSWAFFNKYLFTLFIEGTDELIWIFTSQFSELVSGAFNDPNILNSTYAGGSGAKDPFAFLSQTFDRFTSKETWIKIVAMASASFPIGLAFVAALLVGMYFFILAILKAIVLYLVAIVAVALLLAVAPLFFSLMLFKYTKGYFDNWFNNLINFAMQPVFMFVALGIFNVFVYSALYKVLAYEVCGDCVLPLAFSFDAGDLGTIGIDWCLFYFFEMFGTFDYGGIPISVFTIIAFIIITFAMLKVVEFAVALAARVTTGQEGTDLIRSPGGKRPGVADQFKQDAKRTAGRAGQTAIGAVKAAFGRK